MAYNKNYYDNEPTDGEPPSNNSTTIRYGRPRPAQPDEDTSDYTVFVPAAQNPYAATQRASRTTDHALRAQQQQGSRRPQRDPGPYYQEYDTQGKLKPRRQRQDDETRRTEPRQRAVQPQRYRELQRVTTGPVNPSRRRIVGNLFKGAAVVAVVSLPDAAVCIGEIVNHYSQGDVPHKPVSKVVGHNNDSPLHPTILVVEVSDDHVNFVEKPAGNEKKTLTTPLPSWNALGFHGDISTLFLDIILQPVDAKKYSVIINITWWETWIGVIPHRIDKPFLLVDHGKGYFESTWS